MTSIGAPLLPGAPAPASRHPNDDRGVQCAGISCRSGPEGLSRLPGTQPRPETTSARFGGAFRFPWPLNSPIDRRSPCQLGDGRFAGRPIEGNRGPRALSVWAIRMGQSTSRAMGDCELRMPPDGGHAKLHRQESAASSIGMIRMWLRRVVTLLFRALTAGLDRMTVDSAWTPPGQGSWSQDGRSVAM